MRDKQLLSESCEAEFDFEESLVYFKKEMTARRKQEHMNKITEIRNESVVALGVWSIVVLLVGVAYCIANSLLL